MQTLPTNNVEENIDSNSDEGSSSFYAHKINPTKPLCVTLGIQDITIKFEIDTGSGITERVLYAFSKPIVNRYKNKSSNLCKRTTQGIRKINHFIYYEIKIYNRLPLYVIKGSGVNVLGRN